MTAYNSKVVHSSFFLFLHVHVWHACVCVFAHVYMLGGLAIHVCSPLICLLYSLKQSLSVKPKADDTVSWLCLIVSLLCGFPVYAF